MFCALHEQEHRAKCHVQGWINQKLVRTKACQEHQAIWKKYLSNHKFFFFSDQIYCAKGTVPKLHIEATSK